MKRILTIQDISCVGKCSLTVALPIISALGVETAILPTAVLSTHTMFSGFTCQDLSDQILPIIRHWQKEEIGFDAIYTGYLGTIEQIDLMAGIFKQFRAEHNYMIVDPVMADHGKLYPAFDEAYARKMAELCSAADIILPNITEASLMTGMDYRESYDKNYIETMLRKLADLGARTVILTGVGFRQGMTGVMGYDKENDSFYYYEHPRIDVNYHGTGDIFASTFTGALMRGKSWQEAIPVAADYTAKCIQLTQKDPEGRWYGVNFEEAIPYLLNRMKG